MNVLTKHFGLLRDVGGEADGRIIFKLTESQPNHNMTRYEWIEARVTLMIPYTFNGHDLISVVEGEQQNSTMRTVASITELYALLSHLRMAALGKALHKATLDIPQQMRDIRGTVSNRKVKKKVRATLRKFDGWNLAQNVENAIRLKEQKRS
jgi:hypothetical protein